MYQFSAAAVNNYHELGGLKRQKPLSSQLHSPQTQNQCHWAGIGMLGPYSVWRLSLSLFFF